ETPYGAGEHTIYVSNVDTIGSGNSNYVAAPDAGSAGTFKVNAATVKTTEFNVVKEVAQYGNYYTLNPEDVAKAYNAALEEKYPGDDTLPRMKASDVQIVGGTVTGKNVTNRTYTAKVDFVGDFATEDGKTVDLNWSIGSVNPVELVKFTPEYNEELKACTVVARVTRQETNAAIKEWGLVYDNSGKIAAGTENYAQLLMQDFNTKDYKYKKYAISDPKGTELNVIMANSFVDRPVYAMAYVIYEDGTVEYDSAHAMTSNYFDLVYNNLHINQVDSKLYDNPATAAVEQIPVVELNVQREVAKGYTVTDFGYVYNNSGNLTSAEGAQNWLTLDSTDENCKIKHVEQPATTTSYTGIIANSKYVDGVKVYAKAFVTVKDKANTVKTFMTKVEEKTVDGQTVTDGVFQYKVDVE
ncbi:MAG: hypothetical protein II916_10890, partial [Oscillospiraceae bacterium]|nr:hypothetical protein [Oscillospiraceae bacterium]